MQSKFTLGSVKPDINQRHGDLELFRLTTRIFTLLTVTLCFFGNAAATASLPDTVWQGNGTAEKPFVLKNAASIDSLVILAERCDTDFTNVHFSLAADIATDSLFRPVPFFNGFLHGNGHEITFNYAATADTTGFFRILGPKAEVENLRLSGSISGKSHVGGLAGIVRGRINGIVSRMEVSGVSRVAGIAARIEKGASSDSCINHGSVIATLDYGGGIVAENSGTMTRCVNEGKVSGGAYIAGISALLSETGSVIDCLNKATLNSSSGNRGESNNVAGIVAASAVNSRAIIRKCENYGDIAARQYAGGIGGRLDGALTFDSCANHGTIYASQRYAGGLAAQFNGSPSGYSHMNDSHNEGEVRCGGDYAGGAVGFASGHTTLQRCFNSASVTHTGNVGSYIGGICGMSFGRIQYSGNNGAINAPGCYGVGGLAGTVEDGFRAFNCYNVGPVTATTAPRRGKRGIAGGLTADATDAYFMLCYNLGAVKAESAVGGLAGILHSGTTITASYNAGSITGTTSGSGAQVSAIATAEQGAEGVTIDKVYYDAEVCLRLSSLDLTSGIGVSTAELCENPLGAGFDKASWCYPLLTLPAPSAQGILASACIGYSRAGDFAENVNDCIYLGSRPQLEWSVDRYFSLITPYLARPEHRGFGELTVKEKSSGATRTFKVRVVSHVGVETVAQDNAAITVESDRINLRLTEESIVVISDLTGRIYFAKTLSAGTHTLHPFAKGVLTVRIGGKAAKVLIR